MSIGTFRFNLAPYYIAECQTKGQSAQNCTVRQYVTSKFDIKIFQNSSKFALLHSRNMASLSKKHTGPPPRPLCFVWPVTQISEDVRH